VLSAIRSSTPSALPPELTRSPSAYAKTTPAGPDPGLAHVKPAPSRQGPMVRIHLPPAESLRTIGSSAAESIRSRQRKQGPYGALGEVAFALSATDASINPAASRPRRSRQQGADRADPSAGRPRASPPPRRESRMRRCRQWRPGPRRDRRVCLGFPRQHRELGIIGKLSACRVVKRSVERWQLLDRIRQHRRCPAPRRRVRQGIEPV
jgi:hypothetical protein